MISKAEADMLRAIVHLDDAIQADYETWVMFREEGIYLDDCDDITPAGRKALEEYDAECK